MATFEELSEEDQAIVQNMDRQVRGSIADVARLLNLVQAIRDDDHAVGLVQSLDAGVTIPKSDNLAGSASLTKAELVSLFNTLTTIADNHDTDANRADWSKAVGINAMRG